jgi:hypothetical protein
MPPLCPSAYFPAGHKRDGTWRELVEIRFLGGAGSKRAGTMKASDKGISAGAATNYFRLTDAAIRLATLPSGKSQHYLHDTEQPGLAIRMRATGGRTWVYLFTKPGATGTHRKTLGA